MNRFAFLVAGFLLTGCATNQESLQGTIDRSGRPIITTVYFYDNQRQLHDRYRKIHNLPSLSRIEAFGFARWPEYRDEKGRSVSDRDQPLECEIHIVRPTKINDEATLALGHEMLHCILGAYHRESDYN